MGKPASDNRPSDIDASAHRSAPPMTSPPNRPASAAQPQNPPDLSALARLVAREMRLRTDIQPGLDDARWMILLDIYVAESEGHHIPLMSAAHASHVSVSTAQRYLHEMTADGLIAQRRPSRDQRVIHVALSQQGRALIDRMLGNVADLRGRGQAMGQ